MNVTFANLLGFWALLGVPAVLAIHFLQRESRRVVTSTLFLFEQLAPVSASGRRFERLRISLPLFLQLAAVLLLTWLLVGPRFLRRESSQRVVVVLDSSVSMQAFRPEALRALASRLPRLAHTAGITEWRVFETDTARPTLYAGTDARAALAALAGWQPRLPTHDFAPALRTAQSLARESGVALFVTDRRTDVPDGVLTLAVGHPLDNCGFAGVTVEDQAWHALIKNYADKPQTRTWHLEAGGTASPPETLTLEPGQTRTLSGLFPPGRDRCELVLSGDDFTLDDRLPIVRPLAKRLALGVQAGTPLDSFFSHFAGSIPDADVTTGNGAADLRLAVNTAEANTPGIVCAAQEAPAANYLLGDLVAENHPLTAHLTWNGFLVRDTTSLPRQPGDEVLLWQGERPLLFLRGGERTRSLLVNFDVRQSNADRLPAFVVLLNRFVETIRATKVAPERRNVEANERLAVATAPGQGESTISSGGSVTHAPATPGFFTVSQGNQVLLTGAASFADPREADFRDAGSFDNTDLKSARLVERHSQADLLTPVWALLLGVCGLWSWFATGTKARA